MENNGNGQSWLIWSKYVLLSLEELKTQYTVQEKRIETNKDEYIAALNKIEITVTEKFMELSNEINVIKTKIERRAIWMGALSGFLPAVAALIYMILRLS